CWEVEGVGQFRPLDGADPFLGAVGVLERVKEFKVEMVCADDKVNSVVQALKQAHPYEEPAYDVIALLEI
ncbi:MAG: NGG1p interacting factor NIF3, partial [Pseudomonadales bacterium]|nr:NGG1p interacting factor NIF3 [Pseudomonadales bacterium]